MAWRIQLWWLQKIRKGPKWLQTFIGWSFLLNPLFFLPLIYYFIYNPFVRGETEFLGYIAIFVLLFVSFRYSLWGYSLLEGEKYPSLVKSNKIKAVPRAVQKGSRRLQVVVGFLYIFGSILLFILTTYLASFAKKIYPNLEYLVMLPLAFLIFISFFKGIELLRGREYTLKKSTIGYIIEKIKSKNKK